jgi:hypothetical protein
MANAREFLPSGQVRKPRSPEQIAALGPDRLDFPSQQVGVAGNITVCYDPALGTPGLILPISYSALWSRPTRTWRISSALPAGRLRCSSLR